MGTRQPDLELIMRYLQWWDPIGMIDDLVEAGLPLDEYDRYAMEIHRILESKQGVDKLVETLEDIQQKRMGLSEDRERCQFLAQGLIRCYEDHQDRFY